MTIEEAPIKLKQAEDLIQEVRVEALAHNARHVAGHLSAAVDILRSAQTSINFTLGALAK